MNDPVLFSDLPIAISAAKKATFDLLSLSFEDRRNILKKIPVVLEQHRTEILKVAAVELGRAHSDLELEWSQIIRFFEGLQDEASFFPEGREPRGISAVISSFVWPLFYSLQFTVLNFLAGNPVILKPSEKSGLTVSTLFRILRENIPMLSVVQVLLGEKEMGRRLICHEDIATVVFQGTFEVGMRVKQDALSQPSKEVLLFLGSKNPAIVFLDSPEEVFEILKGDCFLGAGQNCQSVAVIFVEELFFLKFEARFISMVKEIQSLPLIDSALLDRYQKFIAVSERDGAQVLLRGKPMTGSMSAHSATPTLVSFRTLTPDQLKKCVSVQTEILSPHVILIGFESETKLTELVNSMSHGRSASVWTKSNERARRVAESLNIGQVVINSSLLKTDPWTGLQARRKSGNEDSSGIALFNKFTRKKSIKN